MDAGAVPVDASPATDARPNPVRILLLGDSLTLGYGSASEGAGSEGGYRIRLAELLAEAGIDFDFVGSQSHGPDTLGDRDHEGHNGFAISQIAELTDEAIDAFEPDVILLMAGTNDQIEFVPPSQPPEGAAADLARLVEQIQARRPGVQLVVAQVIPLTHNDEGVTAYNALLPAIVSEAGANVRLVDMYAIGTELLSSDGIHPTAEGYGRIAELWFPALRAAVDEL